MVSLASASSSLQVWSFEGSPVSLDLTSRFSAPAPAPGRCSCVAWNHTNQVVAVGGADAKVFLIQANNGQVLSSLQVSADHGNAACVAFSGNSRYLAAGLGPTLQLWDLKRRSLRATLPVQDALSSCCFMPAGEIISGDAAGAVRIWDAKAQLSSGEMHLSQATGTGPCPVTAVGLSPVSASFVGAGYSDGRLGIWDAMTFRLSRVQTVHEGRLRGLAYSPKNPRLVATCGADGRVALVDTAVRNTSGQPSAVIDLAELGAGGEGVDARAVAFHEDAIHCAVGLGDGRVLLYDWRSIKHPVAQVLAEGAVEALAFQVPRGRTPSSSAVGVSTGSVSTSTSAAAPSSNAGTPARAPAPSPAPVPAPYSPPPAHSTASPAPAPIPPLFASPVESPAPTPARSYEYGEYASPAPTSTPARTMGTGGTAGTVGTVGTVGTAGTVGTTGTADTPAQSNAATPITSTPGEASWSQRSAWEEGAGLDLNMDMDNIYGDAADPVVHSHPSVRGPDDFSLSFSSTPGRGGGASVGAGVTAGLGTSVGAGGSGSVGTGLGVGARELYSPQALHQQLQRRNKENTQDAHAPLPPVPPLEGERGDHSQFPGVRQAVRPVSAKDLDDALALLRYDVHREVQEVVREQARQFSIAREDTAELLQRLSQQMADLLRANEELRKENEYLRRIY
ncbi:WD40-repeat-containing domain protein [Ochromonadaceae sp. CCMP2298]|nr:WD40-repeat-containing domain protein [Ochromonadaceae sp. CCMP2298]